MLLLLLLCYNARLLIHFFVLEKTIFFAFLNWLYIFLCLDNPSFCYDVQMLIHFSVLDNPSFYTMLNWLYIFRFFDSSSFFMMLNFLYIFRLFYTPSFYTMLNFLYIFRFFDSPFFCDVQLLIHFLFFDYSILFVWLKVFSRVRKKTELYGTNIVDFCHIFFSNETCHSLIFSNLNVTNFLTTWTLEKKCAKWHVSLEKMRHVNHSKFAILEFFKYV